MGFFRLGSFGIPLILLSFVLVQVSSQNNECVDKDENCPGWADTGECQANPDWMAINCAVSCDTCPTPAPALTTIVDLECADLDNLCPLRVAMGECEGDAEGMTRDCPEACGFCVDGEPFTRIVTITTTTEALTTLSVCEDDVVDCPGWADEGECKANPAYMLISCRLSCKVCQPSGPTTTTSTSTTQPTTQTTTQTTTLPTTTTTLPTTTTTLPTTTLPTTTTTLPTTTLPTTITTLPTTTPTTLPTTTPTTTTTTLPTTTPTTTTTTTLPTTAPTTTPSTTPEECFDENGDCPRWASERECENNPNYMLLYCLLSCHVCGPTTVPTTTTTTTTTATPSTTSSSSTTTSSDGPVWTEDLYVELSIDGLLESTPVRANVGQLSATGSQVVYSIESDGYFSVGANTGRVQLTKALDREVLAYIPIKVVATNQQNQKVESSYNVLVLDINDSGPVFLGTPYAFDIREDELEGRVVYSGISVRDADAGDNGRIDALLCYAPPGDTLASEACDSFEIEIQKIGDVYQGSLKLKKKLDYETRTSYQMFLQAMDAGVPSIQNTIAVDISVLDVQDGGPRFLNAPLSLVVYENVPQGNVIGQLQARDTDSGNPSEVAIRLLDEPSGYFTLGTTTHQGEGIYSADIVSTGRLDKEALDQKYIFTVYVAEVANGVLSAARTESTVTVTVLDENDNAPAFNQQNYAITVNEYTSLSDMQLPSLSMIVTDNDIGENAYFELSFLEESNAEAYSLSPDSGTGSVAVNILVKDASRLDYEIPENRQQILKIVAREEKSTQQQSTTATVTITLKDLNDNAPRFDQESYSTSVRENRVVGFLVDTITATDPDSTNNYGKITYSLDGEDSDQFLVNSQTGQITLAKALDFETQQEYGLTYLATDGGDLSTAVAFRVAVLDFNDQGPIFPIDQYDSIITESSTKLNPNVTVSAFDLESDADVTYAIVGGNTPDKAFRIDPNTGELSLIRTVDYEETNGLGKFELIVEASDNGFPEQVSTVPVVITVIDENNRIPQFGNGIYYGRIPETSPAGTSVVQATATDSDPGQNGQITYRIHSGHLDKFRIDASSGEVFVAPGADLDLEKNKDRYDMTVYAVDGGSPQHTGTTQVIVTVYDENNKIPQFGQDLYVFNTMDTTPVTTVLGSIGAQDPDSGSNIQYSILPDTIRAKDADGKVITGDIPIDFMNAFKIDPDTGALSIGAPLDGTVVAEMEFDVQAEDIAAENPQKSKAQVVVVINTDADQSLQFGPPWSPTNPVIPLTVSEEIPIGSRITTLVASDPQSDELIKNFKIVEGTDPKHYFTVDPKTGDVYVSKRLDYESLPSKTLSFQVEAFTEGNNPKTAVATINVEVLDKNDHSPSFSQDGYTFSVPEGLVNPAQIGVVIASDNDGGDLGDITYSLSGPQARFFQIDPKNGYITVAPNATLDREQQTQLTLTVTAADGGDPALTTSVPVVVYLLDENDNKPVFEQPSYTFNHLENTGAQTSLGRVAASDGDAGASGIVTYNIVGGDEDGLFYVETSTGVIRNRKPLKGQARDQPYTLTIEAQDGGNPAQTSTTRVDMIITSIQSNDGKPVITQPSSNLPIEIPEESVPGTNVTQIEAYDLDPGQAGQIEFGFVPNDAHNQDQSLFAIDSKTGQITVNGRLDREAKDEYQLMVYVRDKGLPPQETVKIVTVRLKDINDQEPYFLGCALDQDPQYFSVGENQPPETTVNIVSACDGDNPPHNYVYYYILDQDPSTDKPVFKINKNTGRISTELEIDREVQSRYALRIIASNDPDLNITVAAAKDYKDDRSVITVVVDIEDEDDNPPRFDMSSTGNETIAAVGAVAVYSTEVVRMLVVDSDSATNSGVSFSIYDCQYIDEDGNAKPMTTTSPFTIDTDTGMISTTVPDFLDYLDGYFSLQVHAVDDLARPALAYVQIYVTRENQRLRFVVDNKPKTVRPTVGPFFGRVNQYLTPKKAHASPDSLHYHVEQDGSVDFDKSNLCFHLIKNQAVVNVDAGITLLENLQLTNEQFAKYLSDKKVIDIDRCEVKTTTKFWSGYWYLWWLLIALAIFIIICSIIFIIVICYMWDKLVGLMQGTKIIHPVHVGTLSHPFHGPNELEWQEEVIQMGY